MLNIKVVGSGCPNCQRLEQLCRQVISEANIDAEIEKITDFNEFAALGIMMTPGLLINDQIMSNGRIPSKDQLGQWIVQASA